MCREVHVSDIRVALLDFCEEEYDVARTQGQNSEDALLGWNDSLDLTTEAGSLLDALLPDGE